MRRVRLPNIRVRFFFNKVFFTFMKSRSHFFLPILSLISCMCNAITVEVFVGACLFFGYVSEIHRFLVFRLTTNKTGGDRQDG